VGLFCAGCACCISAAILVWTGFCDAVVTELSCVVPNGNVRSVRWWKGVCWYWVLSMGTFCGMAPGSLCGLLIYLSCSALFVCVWYGFGPLPHGLVARLYVVIFAC